MYATNSPERASAALLSSHLRHWQHRQPDFRSEAPAPQAFSIAISREAGTRGTPIASALGRRLNWTVYDHQLLELLASTMRVRVKLLEDLDERHANWLQETVTRFCDLAAVSEASFVRHLVETLLSLAVRGECIILGRGSPFVLPPSTTLRVRLTAPLEDRITAVCHEKNLLRSDAQQYIERTDRERAEFVRAHFQHDPADVSLYDVVLNTGRFADEECVNLIIDALHVKQHSPAVAAAL